MCGLFVRVCIPTYSVIGNLLPARLIPQVVLNQQAERKWKSRNTGGGGRVLFCSLYIRTCISPCNTHYYPNIVQSGLFGDDCVTPGAWCKFTPDNLCVVYPRRLHHLIRTAHNLYSTKFVQHIICTAHNL